MKNNNIKAILFDSGKVLNAPASGHWFISPKFYECVDKEAFNKASEKKVSHAFKKANKYIEMQTEILTKEDEYKHFQEFYKIFASELPELNLEQKDIEFLANDLVYNPKKYVFYEDALRIVPKLKEKFKLAIVSDAWPSLKDVYIGEKMDTYFDCFIISSIIGTVKPSEKMYLAALNELNVLPEEAIFVDDNLSNCIGAMKMGIHGILLCRNKWVYRLNKLKSIGKEYAVIDSLEELENC